MKYKDIKPERIQGYNRKRFRDIIRIHFDRMTNSQYRITEEKAMMFDLNERIELPENTAVKAVTGAGRMSDQAMSFSGYSPGKKRPRKDRKRFGLLLDDQIGNLGEGYRTAGYGRDGRKSETLYKTREYN